MAKAPNPASESDLLALAGRIERLPTYSGTDLGKKHREEGQPPGSGNFEDRVFLVHEKWRSSIVQALRSVAQAPAYPDIVDRLKEACNGHPAAKIAWPHRLLHDAIAEIEWLRGVAQGVPSRWRHKKRGTTYELLGNAIIQTETPLSDMDPVVVYRCEEDGTLWVRPGSEFLDGRFEELGDAS